MEHKKKMNPKFVTHELCSALMQAQKDAVAAQLKYIEEKFRGLERTIAVGFTVSSFIVVLVQFIINLTH